jgi:ribosomal protein L29
MGWLADSRRVFEINDVDKLDQLLVEQRAELFKTKVAFGKKKMGHMNIKYKVSETKKIKKNIARILTRKSQLKQQVQTNG